MVRIKQGDIYFDAFTESSKNGTVEEVSLIEMLGDLNSALFQY